MSNKKTLCEMAYSCGSPSTLNRSTPHVEKAVEEMVGLFLFRATKLGTMHASEVVNVSGPSGVARVIVPRATIESWPAPDLGSIVVPPSHGLATGCHVRLPSDHGNGSPDQWTLLQNDSHVGYGRLSLEKTTNEPVTVFLEILVSAELTLTATIHNTGKQTTSTDLGFQVDLQVGDIKDVTIEGLEGCRSHNGLRARGKRLIEGDVDFFGPTDTYIENPGEFVIIDPRGRNRIGVTTHGCDIIHLQNPWAPGTLPPPAPHWDNYLRLYTGDAPDSPIRLHPDEVRTVSVQLAADALI